MHFSLKFAIGRKSVFHYSLKIFSLDPIKGNFRRCSFGCQLWIGSTPCHGCSFGDYLLHLQVPCDGQTCFAKTCQTWMGTWWISCHNPKVLNKKVNKKLKTPQCEWYFTWIWTRIKWPSPNLETIYIKVARKSSLILTFYWSYPIVLTICQCLRKSFRQN